MAYSKHKDCDPQETVDAIKRILADAGVETETRWTAHTFGGMCSMRVTIKGTGVGTNGKGTSEAYATASGYAELMERLQHNILFMHVAGDAETYARDGFACAPDERFSAVEEVFARHEPVLEEWLAILGVAGGEAQLDMLHRLADLSYSRGDHMLCEIPFVELAEGRVVWLPAALVRFACSSNGMAAGNTYEECLVQGLSEVYERYAAAQVIGGHAVPPQVPDAWLEEAGLADLVREVSSDGRYEVRVHDASLGRGYPVAMTTIVDRFRSTFGAKFGAHPSFAVAVERTLTESFQGRDVERASATNHLAAPDLAADMNNIKNVFVNNVGAFPAQAFVGEPDWEPAPWPKCDKASNADMLRHMVGILKREGRRVLVRDSSHLGFCSCMVVVPGMSDVPCEQFLAAVDSVERGVRAFSHFPALTAEEQEQVLSLEPADLIASRPAGLGRFFVGTSMAPGRLFGFLHLTRGEFGKAWRCFEPLEGDSRGIGRIYWRAMGTYAELRGRGMDIDDALKAVRFLNIPAVAKRVERDARAAAEDLHRIFAQMRCYDCERCELREAGGCRGKDGDERAYARLARAIACSTVSQETLLARLGYLVGAPGNNDALLG